MKKEEQQTAPLLIYLTGFNLHPKTTLFKVIFILNTGPALLITFINI